MVFEAHTADVAEIHAAPEFSTRTSSAANALPAGTLFQKTLKNAISCTGIGLHSGKRVSMTLHPAAADTGIVFRRTDVAGGGAEFAATWDNVKDARLCTVIGDDRGATVATIEHLMAALAAMAIDNVVVEINGPEVPAMDGSAAPFVFLIDCAGVATLSAPRTAWKVLKPVSVAAGAAEAALAPGAGFSVAFEIEFAAAAIGRQTCAFAVTPSTFRDAISRARTFGLVEDLPKMREAGLGLGGSLENAVVVNGAEVLNEDGLRYPDEFVRHKALDAIGDLALAGKPVIGRYTGRRSSHMLNGQLVKALLTTPGAVAEVPLTEADLIAAPAMVEPLRASA